MDINLYFKKLQSTTTKFNIETKAGLNLKTIIEIENRLKVKLPNDIIDFYLYTNGLEGNNFVFNIIPLPEVEKIKDATGKYLTFAEYMIYSEICGLELDQADRNKYKFFTHKNDKNKNLQAKPTD